MDEMIFCVILLTASAGLMPSLSFPPARTFSTFRSTDFASGHTSSWK